MLAESLSEPAEKREKIVRGKQKESEANDKISPGYTLEKISMKKSDSLVGLHSF